MTALVFEELIDQQIYLSLLNINLKMSRETKYFNRFFF